VCVGVDVAVGVAVAVCVAVTVAVGVVVDVAVGVAVDVTVGVAVSTSIVSGQGNASITPGSLQRKHPRLKDQTDAGGTPCFSSDQPPM
jgi:hypothetical protein